jgi:hypothetical protein
LEKYDVDVPEEFEATLHGDGTCTAFLIVEVADKDEGFPMEDGEALKAAALELSQWVDVGKVYD